MNENSRLQNHLSLIRSCAGWTAEAFGKRLGVSRQTISAFEREGNELTMMQYLAIRKVLDDELTKSSDNKEMLSLILEVLVDHPENYKSEEREEVLSKAKLMAPAIMKEPSERKTVSMAWKAILIASGVIVTTALVSWLNGKDT